MRLIDNWHRTLTHSYSAWCVYIAIALKTGPEFLPYLSDVIPWYASVGVLGAALVVRLIKQKSVSGEDDDE